MDTVLEYIFYGLDLKSLLIASTTCSLWHRISKLERVWHNLYLTSPYFTPEPINNITLNHSSSCELYKKKYKTWQNMNNQKFKRTVVSPERENGDNIDLDFLDSCGDYVFLKHSGFRVYDIKQNKIVAKVGGLSIVTQQRPNLRSIARPNYCNPLRCDGTFIVAVFGPLKGQWDLCVWLLADVLKGNETPLRTTSLEDEKKMPKALLAFSHKSDLIVMAAEKALTVFRFSTLQTLQKFEIPETNAIDLYDYTLACGFNSSPSLKLMDLSDLSTLKEIPYTTDDTSQRTTLVHVDAKYVACYNSGEKIIIFDRKTMALLFSVRTGLQASKMSFNSRIGLIAIGSASGLDATAKIWNINEEKRKEVFKHNAFPMHISKWDTILEMPTRTTGLHLTDSMLVVHIDRQALTVYDFENPPLVPVTRPDSDDDCDPLIYEFCLVKVDQSVRFVVSPRIFSPRNDVSNHARKIMPKSFDSHFYMGDSELDEVWLYRYKSTGDRDADPLEGRQVLLKMGLKENTELYRTVKNCITNQTVSEFDISI